MPSGGVVVDIAEDVTTRDPYRGRVYRHPAGNRAQDAEPTEGIRTGDIIRDNVTVRVDRSLRGRSEPVLAVLNRRKNGFAMS